jgi:hypothetical protein
MSPPILRAELARAVRVVNVAYERMTPDEQNRVHVVTDELLDRAIVAGDRFKALAQIECWRDRQLAAIDEARALSRT